MKKLSISAFTVFITLFGLFAVAAPASAMTCNSATIESTVSTYSQPVSAHFNYGTDYNQVALGEGIQTPPQTIAPNSYITQLLTGLTESTTYYYKLIVPGQSAPTSINNFTTPSCNTTPPPVQTCQDPSATNYGGALPCQYPVQTCQDPSAINYGGSLPCRYNTIVNNQIPTVSIYANPSSVSYGSSSIISWTSYNANYCSITGGNNNGYNGNQSTSGSLNTGALYYTTTYNIICTSSTGQQASSSTSVYVSGQQIYQPIPVQPIIPVYTQPVYTQPVVNNSLTVVTTQATQVTNTSAQLNSLIGSSATAPINAWFEWGPTINLGNTTTTTAVGSLPSVIHADTLTGLSPGTTYYYQAFAQDSYQSAQGSILSFTTGGVQSPSTVVRYINRTAGNSLVLITSSVNRDQPIVPTIDNTRPHPGDIINYTVNYQNVGTSSATNLSLQLVLPQEVTYLSSNPSNPNILGSTLIFSLGTLRAGASGAVTVKTQVNSDATAGTILNFPATLSYVDASGQPQSVSATVTAQVYDNSSGLGAFAFGAGFFPSNIFGWLLLIILILILLWLARYLYNQKRVVPVTQQMVPPIPPYKKRTTTTVVEQ